MSEDKNDSKYSSLSNDIDDFRHSSGVGSKSMAGAKVLAKSLFNVGVFAVTEVLPGMVEAQKKAIEKQKK
jgi:hypothetical protein